MDSVASFRSWFKATLYAGTYQLPATVRYWPRAASPLHKVIVASTILLVAILLTFGSWLTYRIETSIVQRLGASTVLYTDSLVEPYVQELKHFDTLSASNQAELNNLLKPSVTGKSILAFKIWKGDKIVYSNNPAHVGLSLPASRQRRHAWSGAVSVAVGSIDDDLGAETGTGQPLLEVYAPVRQSGTNNVIALVETYEFVPHLAEQLSDARYQTWLTVALATSLILMLKAALIYGCKVSSTLEVQALASKHRKLEVQLVECEAREAHNRTASERLIWSNEQLLRRTGAELHDGPVQLVGAALQSLEAVDPQSPDASGHGSDATETLAFARDALTDAVKEIRAISLGLAPAGIEHLSLAASLQSAIQRHTRRTGTQVETGISGLDFTVTPALNTCLYRFVQEGLNNAFRHAAGKGQKVDAYQSGQTIEVCISDCGPGLSEPGEGAFGYKQGLIFMRDRIQSLGGQLDIWSRPGQGVRLTARFTMTQEDQDARNNTSA